MCRGGGCVDAVHPRGRRAGEVIRRDDSAAPDPGGSLRGRASSCTRWRTWCRASVMLRPKSPRTRNNEVAVLFWEGSKITRRRHVADVTVGVDRGGAAVTADLAGRRFGAAFLLGSGCYRTTDGHKLRTREGRALSDGGFGPGLIPRRRWRFRAGPPPRTRSPPPRSARRAAVWGLHSHGHRGRSSRAAIFVFFWVGADRRLVDGELWGARAWSAGRVQGPPDGPVDHGNHLVRKSVRRRDLPIERSGVGKVSRRSSPSAAAPGGAAATGRSTSAGRNARNPVRRRFRPPEDLVAGPSGPSDVCCADPNPQTAPPSNRPTRHAHGHATCPHPNPWVVLAIFPATPIASAVSVGMEDQASRSVQKCERDSARDAPKVGCGHVALPGE